MWLVLPGLPDGRGGAFTGGEKLLPPVGLMLFSVGVGDGATDDVVVVVEVLEGAGDSVPLHPAVKAPMAIIALPPATSAKRRAQRYDFIVGVQYFPQPVRVRMRLWIKSR
ncbi:MAG: hypothetical protein QOI01_3827 [Mycobacterium sp.]|nr:hypothetical protein [Mycobacterium sp.]